MEKRYLGDGVYIQWDGNHFVLTSEDGTPHILDTIYLEPEVMVALIQYEKNAYV